MARSWSVVKFDMENTVEAVPSRWIFNNKCYWLPYSIAKIQAAIRNNEEPNTCWPSHNVTVFRNSTYENYSIAKEKAKKAEFTSDLNSDIEKLDSPRISKKTYTKRHCCSSSEEDEINEVTNLPRPPPLQKDSRVLKNNNTIKNMIDNAKIVFSPSNVSTNVLTETEIESFTMEDNFRLDENAIINNEVIPHCNVQRDPDSDNIDRQQCKCCPQHKQNATVENPEKIDFSDKYLKEILRQQHLFKAHLWQMNDDMRNLQRSFNETVRGRNINLNINEDSILNKFEFPLNSTDDLEQLLNNYLLIESNFKSTVIEISKIGGSSIYDFVKRALQLLMTNELASQYSWLGARKKKVFNKLKIADMLIALAQISQSDCSKKECEEAIKKWLRRAKERDDNMKKHL